MRALALLLTLSLIPTAAALPPFFELWQGEGSARAFLANGTTICQASGAATMVSEREMEAATFVLSIEGACAPPLAFRGTLSSHGWRFEDAHGLHSGGLHRGNEGMWHLNALVDSCPFGTICEFPHGVRVAGTFPDPFPVA